MNTSSGSRLTVEDIAVFIAPKINKSWPGDRDEILDTLNLVQEAIWKTDLYNGSTGVFTVNIDCNKQIVTPHGYNILLGINLDYQPAAIRDKYFTFHKNGPGKIERCGWKNTTSEVYDLGERPVMVDLTKIGPFGIAVKSSTSERTPAPVTRVSGSNGCGIVYSYKVQDKDKEETICCNDKPEGIEVVEGVDYKIKDSYSYFTNIEFTDVYNIKKFPTYGAVSYYARKCNGDSILIAKLEPNQTLSSYRVYQVPDNCRNFRAAECLFKRSKPDQLVHGSQFFIVNDKLTVLSMAKYVDFMFNKNSPQEASPFFTTAIQSLTAELTANKSNASRTIQVDMQSHLKGIDD